ncbi:MAG: hypothetical protein ACXIUL_00150 [Wenzhouxiangella sp.]
MKQLKKLVIFYLIYVGMIGTAFPETNVLVARDVETFYIEREFSTTCPPDFNAARIFLDDYLMGAYRGIIFPADELAVIMNVEELGQDNIKILTDREFSSVCEKLNRKYKSQREWSVVIHDSIEPMFVYDISYYQVGDFIMVVRGGGYFILPHPDDAAKDLFWMDRGLGQGIHFYKTNADPITREFLEKVAEQSRALSSD